MFKSVFAKYVTAFMVILTLGFAMLLVIVTSLVVSYSVQAKTELMENAAQTTRVWVETAVAENDDKTFAEIVDPAQSQRLNELLTIFADRNDEMTVLFATKEGSVISSISKNAEETASAGVQLPQEIVSKISAGERYYGKTELPFITEEVLVQAVGIYGENGELCGMTLLYSSNMRWGDMVETLSGTVLTAAMLILIASLIAAYFISERVIGPLKEMSIAAKKFASGKFDSRVRVRGNDEVAALAVAFNDMADSLENLENMRSSFVANVSHDLRTPMTTIAGFIDGIRDGVIPKEEEDHYLDIIASEVRRLSRLVSSLLDLSRIQAGERKFTMSPFDICEMARVILISFEKQIDEKRLDVAFECDSDRMYVNADHDAIYQIFYNVCHNAVKFSKVGGAFRIRIANTKEKKILISVYNEGQGIPQEDIPFVFDRFYKSDKSRGLDKTGIGLGLYISKTIISAHGEKIWVNSEYQKNCEFCFTLSRANHIMHPHPSDV